jgi:multidrug efflux pump subunit AcrA (membrane-fusion protein)
MKAMLVSAFVALALAVPAVSYSESAVSDPVITHCLVSLIEEAEVPGREAGEIASLEAKEGMEVKAGQELGHIDFSVPQAQRAIKEAEFKASSEQATNDVNERFSRKAAAHANSEYQRNLIANKSQRNAVAEIDVLRLKLAWEKATLQIEQAELDRKVAGLTANVKKAEVEMAQLSIDRRKIQSPIDGVVVEVHRHVGEWVPLGDPVLKIVRMDRLRVGGVVSASDFNPEELKGRKVTIEVRLARDHREQFTGKIVFVDPQLQLDNRYRVLAEVTNRSEKGMWVLRPGADATMRIHLDPTMAGVEAKVKR